MKIKASTEEAKPDAVAVIDPPHETALEKPAAPMKVGAMAGEFTREDFRLPRINVVQAVGQLSEDFKPGTILLNKEVELVAASTDPKEWTEPLELIVLNARKQFRENIEFDGDKQPRVLDTLAEVEKNGGWIDWRNDEKPPWSPMLTALLLVKARTEAHAEQFGIPGPDGAQYEMALWTMTGVAFSKAGKAIMTAGTYSLKNKETGEPMLHLGRWHLQVRREKLGTNLVYVPRLQSAGKNDAEFVKFAEGLL